MRSLIRLFNAVKIEVKKPYSIKTTMSGELLEKTLEYGFVFSPEVIFNYSDAELLELSNDVIDGLGLLNKEQLNNTFHKSWDKVKNTPMKQLVLEQALHYLTTYGFENIGIYKEDSVYIPFEKLEIPEIDIDGITLKNIKGYTKNEIKGKVMSLLKSGIALKEDTVKDIIDVFDKHIDIKYEETKEIKNKEVKNALYEKMGFVPDDPVEFLRYVIYKSTGRNLLIKDKMTLGMLDGNKKVYPLVKNYEKQHGLRRLSEIFNRFKPIFLAFRSDERMKPIVNKIGKLSKKYHKPMKFDYLNNVTSIVKNGKIRVSDLERHLEKVNPFRKIRLAYALQYRTVNPETILYKIRNGKGFATDVDFNDKDWEYGLALNVVLNSLADEMRKNIEEKKVFIPEGINYTIPATEKQFVGNFPYGTSISTPKDIVLGVNWYNIDNYRVDLDLSLRSLIKFGWDSYYRSDNRKLLFTGDITDAKGENGATEAFYISKECGDDYFTLNLNYFNSYNADYYPMGYNKPLSLVSSVPYSFIIAKGEGETNLHRNYTINPNNVLMSVKSEIDMEKRQRVLGLLKTSNEGCTFYFAETSIGKDISARNRKYMKDSRKYMIKYFENMLSLEDILKRSGAIITREKEGCDVDLSYETLEKNTIINLFTEKEEKNVLE